MHRPAGGSDLRRGKAREDILLFFQVFIRLHLGRFESQYPRAVSELILVVQHCVVRFSIHPHPVDDLSHRWPSRRKVSA